MNPSVSVENTRRCRLSYKAHDTLGSPIKFKHIAALNLFILGKGDNACTLLVNLTKCLNLIGETNVLYLSFAHLQIGILAWLIVQNFFEGF